MAKTQFNVDQFRAEAVKPLYAVAGATELAYVRARDYASDAQKRAQQTAQERVADVQSRVAKLDLKPEALQAQARTLVNARVQELTKEAKDAQAKFEARVAELQKDAKAFPAKAQAQLTEAITELTATYAELATRGERFVAAIRKDGVKAASAVKSAPNHSTVARREAQLGEKGEASKATVRKAPAKKATTKKATTAKAPTTKAATKKAAPKATA